MARRDLKDDVATIKETGLKAWAKANPKKAVLLGVAVVVGVVVLVAVFTGTPLPVPAE